MGRTFRRLHQGTERGEDKKIQKTFKRHKTGHEKEPLGIKEVSVRCPHLTLFCFYLQESRFPFGLST